MIRIDADADRIYIEAPSRLANLVSALPGTRVQRGQSRWEMPVTWAGLLAVGSTLSHLPGFETTPQVEAWVDRFLSVERAVDAAREGWVEEYDDRLYEYQRLGVALLVARERLLLGDEMGTGKTVMALVAAREVEAFRTLVVAPKSMLYRWARETETWYPGATPFVLTGTPKQREKTYEAIAWHDGPAVVVINWEALRRNSWLASYGSIRRTDAEIVEGPLNLVAWDVVIADEAHRAKDPKAKQTRALWAVAKDARYRWALTGTPVLNTPGDLWAIGRFYDPDSYTSGRHKWHARYVESVDTLYGPQDLGLRNDRAPEFHRWFDLNFLRRTKDEVLDLPEITRQVRLLDLSSKQATAYRKMQKDLIAAFDNEVLVATNPLSLLTRLSQIASAYPEVEGLEVTALQKPSNKVDAVLEIIDELAEDKQLVVFAQSRKLIDLLAEQLETDTYVRITGAEDADMRDVGVQLFQGGHRRLALCTLAAGSEGIDLYAADTAVFMQRSYAYGMNQQAESRIHRAGQTSDKVTVIDLVSKGTVDEEVIEALSLKADMAEQVLRDVLRRKL